MLFSIIIPTYNRADLLSDTVLSVQSQTCQNWECIIVDDGSTDSTQQVVEKIIQDDSRIKYVYQKNAERSAARNNGIKHSSGDYLCFLDSDDQYFPDHLEKLNLVIESLNNNVCMIINDMQIVHKTHVIPSELPPLTENKIEYLYVNPVTPSRVCIHKKILKKELFDEDIVVVEDRILWMRIAEKYPVFLSKHIGVKYLIHDANSVNLKGDGAKKTYEGVILGRKRYPEIFDRISKQTQTDMLARVKTNIAYHYFLNGHKFRALLWLMKALITAPLHSQTKMRLYQIYSIMVGKKLNLSA